MVAINSRNAKGKNIADNNVFVECDGLFNNNNATVPNSDNNIKIYCQLLLPNDKSL